MAFTQAPTNDTYSTHRIPGVVDISFTPHGGQSISFMTNLIANKVGDKEICGESRAPIRAVQPDTSTTSNVARGCYVWEKTAGTVYYFAVFGTKVYTSTTGAYGSWSNVTTLSTSASTPVGFTEFIDSGTNTKSLVLVDGVQGFVFTSNAAGTEITDPQFPTPHLPFPVYLDGYLFLAKANTGDIYNSDLNDPSAWTAGNFISSELYPDDLTAIVKIDNYLLAIGKLGCEYFYDAANPTGTPLARQEGASLPFGCPVPYSIAFNKNTVVMLSNTSDGQYTLKLIEGFRHKDITPSWFADKINRTINAGVYPVTGIRGFFIRHGSQLCYVFTMANITGTTLINCINSLVFALEAGVWSMLDYGTRSWGNTLANSFPALYSCFGSSINTTTFIQGNTLSNTGHTAGRPFFGQLLSGSSGKDDLDYGNTVDFKCSIPISFATPFLDFGTMNQKYMNRVGIFLDLNGSGYDETMNVGYIDNWTLVSGTYTDTGQTIKINQLSWITAGEQPFPFITQLGRFRSRSLVFAYFGGQNQVRVRYIEFDINKGQR